MIAKPCKCQLRTLSSRSKRPLLASHKPTVAKPAVARTVPQGDNSSKIVSRVSGGKMYLGCPTWTSQTMGSPPAAMCVATPVARLAPSGKMRQTCCAMPPARSARSSTTPEATLQTRRRASPPSVASRAPSGKISMLWIISAPSRSSCNLRNSAPVHTSQTMQSASKPNVANRSPPGKNLMVWTPFSWPRSCRACSPLRKPIRAAVRPPVDHATMGWPGTIANTCRNMSTGKLDIAAKSSAFSKL
mmetsp:Transcript_59337/g.171440  ORF Transcript_59337/g.171440 Transcript_59337/m.171440 type:complete len:245 (-) Transcript_59337:151-885(-)